MPSSVERYGISERCWRECRTIVETRYPGHIVDEAIGQGGCSYTVKLKRRISGEEREIDDVLMMQLRPLRFALPLNIVAAAKEWYGRLAPSVSEICRTLLDQRGQGTDGVVVYEMSFLPGRRLDELLPSRPQLDQETIAKFHQLLNNLAAFYAQAWKNGVTLRQSGREPHCTGKVGSTVLNRLNKLAHSLPSPALRSTAGKARRDVASGALDRLPTVLTHGDLLPSNILVDAETWRITGLVDWTESEYLPFGISLYGLEHLLGCTSSQVSGVAGGYEFTYHAEATRLRDHFWQHLIGKVPELEQSRIRESGDVARTVGVLLWHGFAWDEGRIDRVVETGRDDGDIAFLEAFLGVDCSRARL